MKNLFLSLAFMLVGTFAFANTSDNSVDLNKIESLINVENLEIETLEIESVSCGFTISFIQWMMELEVFIMTVLMTILVIQIYYGLL